MIKILENIKKNKFIALIISIYIILAITMPDKAAESIGNSLYYIKEMLTIMPVILVLTSLIEAWVPTKTIQKALGEDAGLKGYVFSFLLGSFSAGPIYAAFPVCKTLLNKGARISNIIIILSAWAVIKVPMLANEAKFLGPKFTFIRWILTTISIFVMAYIVSKIVKKEDVLDEVDIEIVEEECLKIYTDYCIGCGLCAKLSPKNFCMENKKAIIKINEVKSIDYESIETVVNKCPANAIIFNKRGIEDINQV